MFFNLYFADWKFGGKLQCIWSFRNFRICKYKVNAFKLDISFVFTNVKDIDIVPIMSTSLLYLLNLKNDAPLLVIT